MVRKKLLKAQKDKTKLKRQGKVFWLGESFMLAVINQQGHFNGHKFMADCHVKSPVLVE